MRPVSKLTPKVIARICHDTNGLNGVTRQSRKERA